MLSQMTPAELDEWIAYESIEPFWFERLHAQAALGFATLAQCQGAKVKPEFFLIDPEREQLDHHGYASPNVAAAAFGAFVGNRNR